jgi:hypothetical protein
MKKTIYGIILFSLSLALAGFGEAPQGPDEKAFQEVKILIFDQKWAEAGTRLDEFLTRFAKSPLVPQAVYYKGKCLEERGGREREALRSYRDFLQYKDQNRNLAEDAEVSIVDLALALFNRGDSEAWDDLEVRLTHPNRTVRQYAALQISTLKDLELRDRAKIALLRIAPDRLSDLQDELPPARRARTLRIEVTIDGSRETAFSISLPWALADLALAAIPDEEKQALRRQGYDIQRITAELQSARGKIVEIRLEGKRLLRIWQE